MKIHVKIFLAILIPIALLSACTIEKRLYSKGYNVSWNKRSTQKKIITVIEQTKKDENEKQPTSENKKDEQDSYTGVNDSSLMTASTGNAIIKEQFSTTNTKGNSVHNFQYTKTKSTTKPLTTSVISDSDVKILKKTENEKEKGNVVLRIFIFFLIFGIIAILALIIGLSNSKSMSGRII